MRYDTTTADFDSNDDSTGSSQDDLSVGYVVVVTFDPAAPTVALGVIADEAAEGPVNSVDIPTGSLVVAGQTVLTDASTSCDDSNWVQSLADIQQNNFAEVSGFFDGDGNIRATRIEKKAAAWVTEVHGVVSARTATTFAINGLQVNYTSVPATIDDDFPQGTFNNGDLAEVKGSSYSGATLLATKIEPDGFSAGDGGGGNGIDNIEEAEIEGCIPRFDSVSDFAVAGVPVKTDAGTVYEGGVGADLALNVKVDANGVQTALASLAADEIELED